MIKQTIFMDKRNEEGGVSVRAREAVEPAPY